jgi:tetratricopeptide (TPR) repeat protein
MEIQEFGQEVKLNNRLLMLSKDPLNKVLRGNCIDLALHQKNYNVVLLVANDALAREPTDHQAKFERASALIGLRRINEALDDLNYLVQELELTPPSAVLQNIGLCHYLLGDFVAARTNLERVYAAGVRSADLARLLISSLHHLGEILQATSIADDSNDLGKMDASLAGVMALLYLDANQPQKAAKWSSYSLAKNPYSLDGMVTQGTLRAGTFDLRSARELFERALSIAPTAGRAWLGVALVSMAEHDLGKARDQVQEAVKYMPTHIGSWHVLGWIQLIQGELEAARSTFEHALSLNRNFAESHGGLGAIAALQGNRSQSERYIEVAERLDPHCLSAKFARSTLQKGTGDEQAARETLIGALSGIAREDRSIISRIVDELSPRK